MFKIRTYNQISVKGLERFARDRYEVGGDIGHPDAFLVRSHKLHGQDVPPSLLAVARAGAGVNNVPVAEYGKKGIVVFNTPGANANAVKELVIAGMLLATRGILPGIAYVGTLGDMKDADAMSALLEKEKSRFAGGELKGKTLGIVGLGAIGGLVADAGAGAWACMWSASTRRCRSTPRGACRTRSSAWRTCRRCWRGRTTSRCTCPRSRRRSI